MMPAGDAFSPIITRFIYLVSITCGLLFLQLVPKDGAAFDVSKHQKYRAKEGILVPLAMMLMNESVAVQSVYDVIPNRIDAIVSDNKCSCVVAAASNNNNNNNATFSSKKCCKRGLFRTHKMGFALGETLFQNSPYQKYIQLYQAVQDNLYNTSFLPQKDYRDVIILRNIYDALVSGYLYHKSGRECHLDENGNPKAKAKVNKTYPHLKLWYQPRFIRYTLNPPHDNRSFCNYLAEVSPRIGMRVYIEWVFSTNYRRTFSHWALAQQVEEMRERTLSVCFEDLMEPKRKIQIVDKILEHYLGNTATTTKMESSASILNQGLREATSYHGGHSTSHNPKERQELVAIIQELDEMYYQGEIAWMSNVLPC